DGRVVRDHRAACRGGAGDGEREAGVVGSSVPVQETGCQPVGFQRGQVLQRFFFGQAGVAVPDAYAASAVVVAKLARGNLRQTRGGRRVLAQDRDQERQRRHEVRCVLQQPLTLVQ